MIEPDTIKLLRECDDGIRAVNDRPYGIDEIFALSPAVRQAVFFVVGTGWTGRRQRPLDCPSRTVLKCLIAGQIQWLLLSLLLWEKGDRADFRAAECRTVDEELLCVSNTSSVIATLASPSRDATFPYWGRQ